MATAGNNHSYSGRYNRRLVFDLVRTAGGLTRGDLVERTGLSPQTLSNISRELVDRGLLTESSHPEGGRGAPQRKLQINARAGCTVGIHLDRDGVSGVLCDLLARKISIASMKEEWRSPQAAIETISSMVKQLLAQFPESPAWGIGVSMPTLLEAVFEQYVGSPGWQEWQNLQIAEVLEGACELPVVIENDATTAAIAELHAGAAIGLENYVYIFVGHGLGAGIIVDGLPFQGFWSNAGEIGLMAWPAELRMPIDTDAIAFSLDELQAMRGDSPRPDAQMLEQLYRTRDSALMEWLALNASRLRYLTSIVENLLDPQTILLGGRLPLALTESLVDRAYPLMPSVSSRSSRPQPRLQAARLGAEALTTGAAMLPVMAHGSPDFRRISLMRGRSSAVDLETVFDRVTGPVNDSETWTQLRQRIGEAR